MQGLSCYLTETTEPNQGLVSGFLLPFLKLFSHPFLGPAQTWISAGTVLALPIGLGSADHIYSLPLQSSPQINKNTIWQKPEEERLMHGASQEQGAFQPEGSFAKCPELSGTSGDNGPFQRKV